MKLTKTLLPQRDTFQLLESVLLCGTVDDRVLQERPLDGVMIDGRFTL